MKILILFLLIQFYASILYAQNIGIGIAVPAFKLDVKGGSINTDSLYRIGGNAVLSVKGSANTFVGINSGGATIPGNSNTALGLNALYSITEGSLNCAIGVNALYKNTTGYYNTAAGVNSLYYNNGYSNVSTGFESLFSNTTGSYNVAYGVYALYHNINGQSNTALGHQALLWNTSGDDNVATGIGALHNNETGDYNIGSGSYALFMNTAGYRNVGIGAYALQNTRASAGNTAIGFAAGDGQDNGYYNTFLGSESDANGPGYYNSVAIGNSSTVTAPVQIRIGASFIGSIGGYQNWSMLSDGRFKKNIKEDVKGLDFIMKLRPVTYNMDISGISEKLDEGRGKEIDAKTWTSIVEKEKTIYSGFVAQEVEQAIKETGYDFSGLDKPKNENDFYALRYAEFVVPLVKAVQEQQATIEALQKKISSLERKISQLLLP